jgi:hypothetical protein
MTTRPWVTQRRPGLPAGIVDSVQLGRRGTAPGASWPRGLACSRRAVGAGHRGHPGDRDAAASPQVEVHARTDIQLTLRPLPNTCSAPDRSCRSARSAYHWATEPRPKTSTAQSTYSREATVTALLHSNPCNEDRLQLRSVPSPRSVGDQSPIRWEAWWRSFRLMHHAPLVSLPFGTRGAASRITRRRCR